MHGQVQTLTPKQILAEKISMREKQKKILLRQTQKKARLEAVAKPTDIGERISLTPEMALALLESNTLNRPLSDAHVHRISRQIGEGKWKFNGDTIKVADTGDVLDGQHRLWAVIEAKKAVQTLIVYGISRDAFATIDTMRRSRSGADVLALNGVTRNRGIVAMALTWLLRWQNDVTTFKAPEKRIENADIEKAWQSHEKMADAVNRAMKLRSILNPSMLGFFYYVLSNLNNDLAERMMSTFEKPAGIGVSDPFYKLRDHFLQLDKDDYRRKEPLHSIALLIKAANAAHAGKKIEVLRWTPSTESFPKLSIST